MVLSFLSALAVKKQLYKHLVFCPFHSLIDNDNDDDSNDNGNNVVSGLNGLTRLTL